MFSNFSIDHLSGYSSVIILGTLFLIGISFIIAFSHYFAKYVLINGINKFFNKQSEGLSQIIFNNHVFHRIAYLIPALLLYQFSYLFDIHSTHLKLFLSELVKELTRIYLIIGVSLVISALLNCVNERYNQLEISKHKPIKSYLQVAKIILFSITSLIVASLMINKSPAYFFTGVGAATAFIAFLFKDSMMGFIASIQLAAYDMVRIGDWIEMPAFGADGEVTEISLNTVKVQNFDKTIVTIPSYALLTTGLKNWRGMYESGGRLIKRSINIDINSIKLCDENLVKNLEKFKEFLPASIEKTTTNIGLFRMYLENFLMQHALVHQEMRILIRQMQGTPMGLPLELYFYAAETDTKKYEGIQSEIIEYVYALIPQFGLRAFQYANSPD